MRSEHDGELMRNWQNLASSLVGGWLLISPSVLGYARGSQATADVFWIAGAVLLGATLLERVSSGLSEGIVECVLGICLMVSPWELDYSAVLAPTANAMAAGLLLVLLSLSMEWRDGASDERRGPLPKRHDHRQGHA